MARTNALTTAKRIRRQLGSNHRMEQNTLLGVIDSSVTTFQFGTQMPPAVVTGAILGIELELMRVVSADTGTNTVTVMRGAADSEPAGHGAGTIIDIAPRFPLMDVFDAMLTEIDSWGRDLYWMDSDTFTVAAAAQTLELLSSWSDIYGVIDVMQSELQTTESVWPRVKSKLIRGDAVGFDGAPTSGMLLRFLEPIRSGQVYVKVAHPFSTDGLTAASDLVDDVHLSVSMLDVLELGTRIRLVMNDDDTRTGRGAQDEPRRAEETPLGSMVSLSQLRLARYTRRKADEMSRLRTLYPIRMS